MSDENENDYLSSQYVEYAELINKLSEFELKTQNMRRLVDDLKSSLSSDEYGKRCGLELTAHAFKNLSERLEKLATENTLIWNDVFDKPTKSECLLLPSNLKCFIITLLADAHKKGNFTRERSKNNVGNWEYRYSIDIKKWSDEKMLQLTCIVENNMIKTGYFNWI